MTEENSADRLKRLLTILGYPPTKKVSDLSPNEDFFEVVLTFKDKPDKYGLVAVGGKAIGFNLSKTREEIIQMVEEIILIVSPVGQQQ